jgi:hypothetical protein
MPGILRTLANNMLTMDEPNHRIEHPLAELVRAPAGTCRTGKLRSGR